MDDNLTQSKMERLKKQSVIGDLNKGLTFAFVFLFIF